MGVQPVPTSAAVIENPSDAFSWTQTIRTKATAKWFVTGGMMLGALGGTVSTGVGALPSASAVRNVTDWTSNGTITRARVTGLGSPGSQKLQNTTDLMAANARLAEAVRRLHQESGLTWAQLAKLFGVSRRALHNWAANGRMNAVHAERLASLTRLIGTLPETDPDARRARMLTPDEMGRSMYDIARSTLERGVPVVGTPFRPEDLLEALHDRVL